MKIEGKDYIMESVRPDCPYTSNWFFDLYLLTIVNEGKINERFEMQLKGYGCIVPRCIEWIAENRTKDEQEKSIIIKDLTQEFKDLGLKIKK